MGTTIDWEEVLRTSTRCRKCGRWYPNKGACRHAELDEKVKVKKPADDEVG